MGGGVSAPEPGVVRRLDRGEPEALPLSVLKIGSSVLSSADGFRAAARRVAEEVRSGRRVVAVVSAVRGATDDLDRWATGIGAAAPHGLLASLLANGEASSVALLGIALASERVPARLLSAHELGLVTVGPLLDADPIHVDGGRLRALLEDVPVLVAPGFVGVDRSGALSLLGRGGSDLTALFLAHGLGADECVLLKDVDGVYPTGELACDGSGEPLERATWDELLALGARVVQEKAVRYARAHGLEFRVAALAGRGTCVGAGGAAPC